MPGIPGRLRWVLVCMEREWKNIAQSDALSDWVLAAQAGDPVAFNAIVERFSGYALRRAYAWLGDRGLAEDVVQEAFLEASLKLHQLREPAAFSGWFRRIVLKRCDRITRRKRLVTKPLEAAQEVASEADSETAVVLEERREQVLTAISGLPLHEQGVVRAFYLEGVSQKEIAQQLGLPLTTVKKRLYSARQRLRPQLTMLHAKSDGEVYSKDGERERMVAREAALFMAVAGAYPSKVARLLQEDAALAGCHNEDKMPILLFAAHAVHAGGSQTVVELLLQFGAEMDWFSAAALGRLPELQMQLRRSDRDVDVQGAWGRTALHWAACGGHVSVMQWLLKVGGNPEAVDRWGCTPLHLAADFGRIEALNLLLAAGVAPDCTAKSGKRPLHLAAGHGRVALLRPLLARGAVLDLFSAAALGDVALAQRLLKQQPEALATALDLGATPLHVAAEYGRVEMAQFLLEQGALLDVVGAAQLREMEKLERLLCDSPELVNVRGGSFGFTPLHCASVQGSSRLVQFLLARGAEINARDRMYQKTPLCEALYFGRAHVVDLLLRHGGDTVL